MSKIAESVNCESYGSSEYLSWKELLAKGDDWKWRNHGYSGCGLHLLGDFKFLSNDLRSLHWHGYPLKTLPENFYPEKLVELNMCSCQLAQLWKGNKVYIQFFICIFFIFEPSQNSSVYLYILTFLPDSHLRS